MGGSERIWIGTNLGYCIAHDMGSHGPPSFQSLVPDIKDWPFMSSCLTAIVEA